MEIRKAVYGIEGRYVDITMQVRSKVQNGKLYLPVNNNIAGDPAPGHVKHLAIDVTVDGIDASYHFKENTVVVLPMTQSNKLGIFYSNNHDTTIYPAISASLSSIERAAQQRADIITCMWRKHPNNPFTELLAWTNTSSHLNQILQILQCLYTAGEVKTYKYVSFLEHDLLYPEGYFDYPDFDSGIIGNDNYMGLIKTGWQKKNQPDQPLSQLTMLYTDAVEHFNLILKNALVRNSGLIEPQVKIDRWNSQNPAVHINHGRHFTSHYSIYQQQTFPDDPYWGNYSKYSHLFVD